LNQLIITSDGSHTIYVPDIDEHYHSVHGAIQESNHIFIKNGFEICKADPLNIFEVGFGTGLNALLTALKCLSGNKEVNYTSIEKYPLYEHIVRSLNYSDYAGENAKEIFQVIHSVPWNISVNVCKNFNLKKIEADLTTYTISGRYDLIYFDAFGPDKQPEMWTREIFDKIASITNRQGIFVTYSAKGEVRRALKSRGFEVTLLPGPPGKRHMISSVKF
jgi:tRNA U34 5-methylaminomethyl-2-thiouridine-forming methyltransferase MnmC